MSINSIVRQIGSPTDIVQRGFVSGTVVVITNYHVLVGRQMITTLSDTSAPIDLAVDSSGGVSSLTVTVALRDPANSTSYLDFSDSTFKTSGWVNKVKVLSEVGGGFYSTTLDVSSISNFPSVNHAVLEYSISGSVTAIASGVLSIAQTWEHAKALTLGKFIGLK